MRFSASRLKMWSNCPLQAHYHYDQGLARRQNAKASYGAVIHRALEQYNLTGNLKAAKNLFLDLWANPEKAGVTPDFWPNRVSYDTLRRKGIETLEAYDQKLRFEDRTVVGTEIPFLVPFGEHELHGYVDLVDIRRSGTGKELLRIVDWKTNSAEPNRTELALDIQFTVYAYAVTQREFWCGVDGNPEFPGVDNGEWLWQTVAPMTRRCIWYQLSNQKEIDAGPRETADFERLYRVCEQIARAIDLQVHVPKIGASCTWCDFTEQCELEIPVAIAQLTQATDSQWL